MSEIGKEILLRQDNDRNIKRLAAQNEIYLGGKKLFVLQVIVAVPIPIIISILPFFFRQMESQLSWLFIIYSIIATFLEFFFDNRNVKLKKLAANIQEKFDCDVLDIKWNKVLLPKKIDEEFIYRYYKRFVKNKSKENLYGWYSEKIEPVNTNVATLLCQRTNCNYDFSLRRRYSNIITILTILTFTLLLIIANFYNITLRTFITNVFFPSLPIFVLAYKQISANIDAIENLEDLKDLIEDKFSSLKIDDTVPLKLIRQIQDKIYLKRINSPLLPEWVYNLLRKNLEEEMHFSVEEKVGELN